jgi:hypothetical protein
MMTVCGPTQIRKENTGQKRLIEGLLDKFANHDVLDIADPDVLDLPPFTELGSKMPFPSQPQ